MTYTLEEARQAVISVALRLKESDLIVRTYGNISCRVNEDQFVITPSGRDHMKATYYPPVNIWCIGSHISFILELSASYTHIRPLHRH